MGLFLGALEAAVKWICFWERSFVSFFARGKNVSQTW